MTDVKSEEGQSRSGPDAFKKDFARMDRPVVHRFMDRPVVHEDENVEEKMASYTVAMKSLRFYYFIYYF